MFKNSKTMGKFPHTFFIAEPTSAGFRWTFDKGKRINDVGEESYYLKKRKKKICPPEYLQVGQDTKGNNVLFTFSPDPETFAPFEFDINKETAKIKISPDTEFKRSWRDIEYRRTFLKYKDVKSTLDKLLPILLVMGVGMAIAFMFWGNSQVWKEMVEFQKVLGTQMIEVAKNLGTGASSGTVLPP